MTTETELPQGETPETPEAELPPPMSEQDRRRLAAAERIQQRIEEERAADDKTAKLIYDPESGTDEGQTESPGTQAGEAGAEPALSAPEPEGPVKLKVDGEEFDVPRAEVLRAGDGNLEAGIRIMQKEAAAQKRLDHSKAIAAQAQAYAQQVLAASQAVQQRPQEPTPATPDDAAILEAIRFGDPAEATRALQILEERAAQRATSRVPQAMTPEQVQFLVQDRLDYQKSMEVLQRDFSDIVNDPNLNVLAGAIFQQKRAAGDQRPRVDVLAEVASEIRKWRGEPAKIAPDKLERKKTIQVVKPANVRSAPEPEEKPKTTQEIIEEMRAQRVRGGRS